MSWPGRWRTEAQGSHCREGEAGHRVLLKGSTGETLRSPTVSTKRQRIASQAADYPQLVFTTLAHLIDVKFLREAFRRIRKSSSPGLDKVTARQYAEDLEENLADLYERMRSGLYKAPPVVRVWLEKEDGKRRPIGKLTATGITRRRRTRRPITRSLRRKLKLCAWCTNCTQKMG